MKWTRTPAQRRVLTGQAKLVIALALTAWFVLWFGMAGR